MLSSAALVQSGNFDNKPSLNTVHTQNFKMTGMAGCEMTINKQKDDLLVALTHFCSGV